MTNAVGTAYLGMVSSSPAPSWVPETGPIGDTDPSFAGVTIEPKRISGKVIVSSMLLSMRPDAEALITADLGRSLSSQLDKAIYFGTGTNDLPLGIAAHPKTHKIAFDAAAWWRKT
jgi:HK97 family phage major capsid protein